ncbi:MAG: 30S ribosomal protein S15, partial [Pirellula sp.]
MTVSKERKAEIIGTFKQSDADNGSADVQIALLTERINGMTELMRR